MFVVFRTRDALKEYGTKIQAVAPTPTITTTALILNQKRKRRLGLI
jgi:hypothetical protein